MPKYRVYGRKNQDFMVIVNAPNATEAAKIANNLSSHLWSEIETDDIIEAIDVVEDEYRSR